MDVPCSSYCIREVKKVSGKSILIDYYIEIPNEDSIYAFSKRYTNTTYDMCKSGVRVNKLICTKIKKSSSYATCKLHEVSFAILDRRI